MMKIILLGYIFYPSLKVNTTSSKMCESLIHYLFLSDWLNPTLLDIFCRLSSLVSSPWLEIFSMFPWRLLVDKTSYYLSPRGCSFGLVAIVIFLCCNLMVTGSSFGNTLYNGKSTCIYSFRSQNGESQYTLVYCKDLRRGLCAVLWEYYLITAINDRLIMHSTGCWSWVEEQSPISYLRQIKLLMVNKELHRILTSLTIWFVRRVNEESLVTIKQPILIN